MNTQQAILWLKDNNFRLTSDHGIRRVDWMQDGEHQFLAGKYQITQLAEALQKAEAKSDYMMAKVVGT